MSQGSIIIANGTGASVRSGINNALQTLATQYAGPTQPSPISPYMWWLDTTANLVKQANSSGTAFVRKGTLLTDGTIKWDVEASAVSTASSIVCMGDSETACYPYFDNSVTLVPPTDAQDIANTSSWTNVIRQTFNITVHNKGIGGNTTAEMVARFTTDVINLAPTHCIIEGMINDIVKTEKLVSAANTQANFVSMINSCITHDIKPIVMISAPLSPITGLVTAANITDYLARINTLITYCNSNNIPVINTYNLFIQNIVGTVITSLIYTDNLHPNTAGYLRIGDYACYRLRSILPEFRGTLSNSDQYIGHYASGQAPNIGYKKGDLVVESSPVVGNPLLWTCLDANSNTWGGTGVVRSTKAVRLGGIAWIGTNDTTDYYWEAGDTFAYKSSSSNITIYKVTAAGWSNSHPVVAERATFSSFATINTSS